MSFRLLPFAALALALSLLSVSAFGQTPQFSSQAIEEQAENFHVEFTAVASVDSINGIIGLGPVAATEFNSMNALIRFNGEGRFDAYNKGAEGGPYVAENSVIYSANTQYYFSVDVDLTNNTYSVTVTEPGEGTTVIATDYAFRDANVTGAIGFLTYAQPFSDEGTDAGKHLGVSQVQVGEFEGDNFNLDIPTIALADAETFAIKFDAMPTANNTDGVVGFGGVPIAGFGDFNMIVRFNGDGLVDVRNGGGYAAENELPYAAGERYNFYISGRFSDSTYSVTAVDGEGVRTVLATDYKFRADNYTQEFTHFAVKRNGGGPIGIGGLMIGDGGSEGDARIISEPIEPALADEFEVSYLLRPSADSIDAAFALGPIPSILWNDYNMIVRFNGTSKIDVRNGDGYAADEEFIYIGGRSYEVRIVGNTTARTYDVFVSDREFGEEVQIADDYAFRGEAAGPIAYRHTKEVVGFISVDDIGFPLPNVKPRANRAPTALPPTDSITLIIQDDPVTLEFRDVTDGDIGQQGLTVTVDNEDPAVVSVGEVTFDTIAGTITFTLDGLAEGTSTVTVRIADDGGTDNEGVDAAEFPIFVTVQPQGRFRTYEITTAEGAQGADARVLTGKDDVDNNFGWLGFHAGIGGFNNSDNGPAFGTPTGIPRFLYVFYLRFDLSQLPFDGDARSVTLEVEGATKTPESDFQEDFVLYAVKDDYRGGDDARGNLDELGETEWAERETGGSVVLDANNDYLPGFENALVSDNAPGFEEIASLNGVGNDYSPYNEDVLDFMGTFSLAEGSSKLTMSSEAMLEAIQNDLNFSQTFVLGIQRSTGADFNAWPVYTAEDFGREPTLAIEWDFANSVTELSQQVVRVYPNPTEGTLRFDGDAEVARAIVTDQLGRQIADRAVDNAAADFSDLPARV